MIAILFERFMPLLAVATTATSILPLAHAVMLSDTKTSEACQVSAVDLNMTTKVNSFPSLARARQLSVPQVSLTSAGETENLDFWAEHESLFQSAWHEWSTESNRALLPDLDDVILLNPTLYSQMHDLWEEPTQDKEERLKSELWEEPIPGVFVCPHFLTGEGIKRIRKHLKEASTSGIPARRPNGMNRFGLVLDEETQGGVSYPAIDSFRKTLVDTYVRPLGRLFFPALAGKDAEDDLASYMFTIHYEAPQMMESDSRIKNGTAAKGDVELKEHSDASVFTMNINLNLPEEIGDCEGSSLEFVDADTGMRSSLTMKSGMAIIHRGLHRHQASSIENGRRDQMVIWLFGPYGYVRFVPYEPKEQMTLKERWRPIPTASSTESDAHRVNFIATL